MKYDLQLDINVNTSHALMLQRITEGSKVLEFGSASGYMTKYLKEKLNCEITCVEIDREAAQKAQVFSKKMIVADLEQIDKWTVQLNEKYDYILFADVLEHLRDPATVLKEAVNFLAKNGTVMTSVPNISHNAIIMELLEGKFDYQPTGLLDDTHVHFFTRKSVFEILEHCGLQPVEWLSTMRKPDSTEFHQSYSNFPIPVANFLEERKDGDIYQYVTISKRIEEATNFPTINPEQENGDNHLDLDQCQLYFEKNGEYAEEDSLLQPIKYDNEVRKCQFLIPKSSKGNIRIDPCSTQSIVNINYIKIYNVSDQKVLLESNSENQFSGIKKINQLYQVNFEKKSEFISLTQDPNFILDTSNLKFEEQAMLEIEMSLNKNKEDIFNLMINRIDTLINEKSQIIQSKDTEIGTLQTSIQNLENQVVENKNVIQNLQNQLSTLEVKYEEKEKVLSDLLNSKSWKYTELLRKISNKFK